MATTVHVPAVHSTPSAFGSFNGCSPRGVELEERLDRSLDALIKERKKEEKAKKREEVAAKAPATPVKTKSREAKKTAVKTQQTAKRNAIVSKNRGLPVIRAATANAAPNNAKKAAKKTAKTKTSITEVTAQLRHKMRLAKNGGQHRTSVKSAKKAVAQSAANIQRVVRKQDKPAATKPNTQASQKAKKQTQPSAGANQPAKTKNRSVVRADSKKGKLKITISAGNDGKRSRSKNANAVKRQTPAVKKILPGKVNAKALKQQTLPKKTGKQSKKSRKHQATASVVVRQPFTSRKKN